MQRAIAAAIIWALIPCLCFAQGAAVISPNTVDTTLIQDGQAAGSITPARIRQLNDSLSSLYVTTQGSDYTFALADRGTLVESTSASPVAFTVAPDGTVNFVVYTIVCWRQYGAGQITLTPGSGVTIRTPSSLLSRVQYSTGCLQKRASNEWIASGDMQ